MIISYPYVTYFCDVLLLFDDGNLKMSNLSWSIFIYKILIYSYKFLKVTQNILKNILALRSFTKKNPKYYILRSFIQIKLTFGPDWMMKWTRPCNCVTKQKQFLADRFSCTLIGQDLLTIMWLVILKLNR